MKSYYVTCFLFLCIGNEVYSQSEGKTSSTPEPTIKQPQVPYFLHSLGEFFLDIDDAIYKIATSKEESGETKNQIQEVPNRRRLDLENIRKNYKDLQKKFRQSLEESSSIFSIPNLMNVNFQNKDNKAYLDISSPVLPMNLNIKTKSSPTKAPSKQMNSKAEKTSFATPKLEWPLSDISGNINVGKNTKDLTESQKVQKDSTITEKIEPKEIKNDKDLKDSINTKAETEPTEFQERSSRNNKRVNELRNQRKPSNTRHNSEYTYAPEFDSETPFKSESGVQGRILGDLLFSESTFDKYFRRMLEEHGKWFLDPPVFPPKNIVENVREITRSQGKNKAYPNAYKENFAEFPQKSSQTFPPKTTDDKYFNTRHETYSPQFPGSRYGSKVILAFTSEGVPLKLKLDPHLEDPLEFLHDLLSSEKVSLNVPVDSRRGIYPVGNDILQLGSGYNEMQPRVLTVDLSNTNQSNALLRALKKFQY